MSELISVPTSNHALELPIVRFRKGRESWEDRDYIIEERPVAISFNGIAYTVMMCTPRDIEYFVIGFSLSEGIIQHHREVHDIEINPGPNGIAVDVTVANRCLRTLKEKRRSLAGMTGCGICGEEKLETVCRILSPLTTSSTFDICKLESSLEQLLAKQQLNQLTGSAHAAVYLDKDGQVKAIFEDVGRHIALDKLVGYIHRHRLEGGAVLVTSRASFEMVQKAAAAGIEILLAISSATNMAVELAEKLNVTLLGYCRPGRADVYAHPERVYGMI
ncbi:MULTISPECIES: formate dehydrogenase accessory sulfurtransferase FdhD [Photobacterium]|nr:MULTISPECIES: formate dehydrogenase accessory sulfurtransferase FdhD [Photobacterium]